MSEQVDYGKGGKYGRNENTARAQADLHDLSSVCGHDDRNVHRCDGCGKLKTLVIRSSQIKSFGKGALKKTYAKMKVSVPKAAKKKYKKLLKKAGISKKAKIR